MKNAGILSATALQLDANPLGMPIGCQTYPVRALIGQDFAGAIKQLAERTHAANRAASADLDGDR